MKFQKTFTFSQLVNMALKELDYSTTCVIPLEMKLIPSHELKLVMVLVIER